MQVARVLLTIEVMKVKSFLESKWNGPVILNFILKLCEDDLFDFTKHVHFVSNYVFYRNDDFAVVLATLSLFSLFSLSLSLSLSLSIIYFDFFHCFDESVGTYCYDI